MGLFDWLGCCRRQTLSLPTDVTPLLPRDADHPISCRSHIQAAIYGAGNASLYLAGPLTFLNFLYKLLDSETTDTAEYSLIGSLAPFMIFLGYNVYKTYLRKLKAIQEDGMTCKGGLTGIIKGSCTALTIFHQLVIVFPKELETNPVVLALAGIIATLGGYCYFRAEGALFSDEERKATEKKNLLLPSP